MPDEHEETEEQLEDRLRKLLGDAETTDSDELDEIELKLRGLEDKISAHQEERKETEGFFDAEFEERLGKLHDKANLAKEIAEGKKREQQRNFASERETARGLGFGLTIAYTIIGLPLAGLFIGWLIDRSLGTTMAKGIGVIVGAALGMVMALVMLAKTNQNS